MTDLRVEGSSGPSAHELAEASVARVIQRVEFVLNKDGMSPRTAGARTGYCGFASDLVRRAAEVDGFEAHTYQVMDIHGKLGGNHRDSFQHGFNILDIEGNQFLADESFGQFVNPQTGLIHQGITLTSGSVADHPVAEALIRDGFIPLTEENFAEYLRATTSARDKSYIGAVKISDITSDPALRIDYDHTPDELDAYLEGRAIMR